MAVRCDFFPDSDGVHENAERLAILLNDTKAVLSKFFTAVSLVEDPNDQSFHFDLSEIDYDGRNLILSTLYTTDHPLSKSQVAMQFSTFLDRIVADQDDRDCFCCYQALCLGDGLNTNYTVIKPKTILITDIHRLHEEYVGKALTRELMGLSNNDPDRFENLVKTLPDHLDGLAQYLAIDPMYGAHLWVACKPLLRIIKDASDIGNNVDYLSKGAFFRAISEICGIDIKPSVLERQEANKVKGYTPFRSFCNPT